MRKYEVYERRLLLVPIEVFVDKDKAMVCVEYHRAMGLNAFIRIVEEGRP